MKMKSGLLFFCLMVSLFYACKKKEKETPSNPPSQRYIDLTQHKWLLIHEYEDSSAYAHSHIGQMPIAGTYDYFNPTDTCSNTSKAWWRTNGNLTILKGHSCPAANPDTSVAGTWKLITNDTQILMNGTDTFFIVQLDANYLKYYYLSNHYNGSNQFTFSDVELQVYKSTN